MSFAAYMIAFLVCMAGVVWAAVVVGVPQQYIAIAVFVLLAVAAAWVVTRSRSRLQRRQPDR